MFSIALHCPAVEPECQTGQAYSRTGLTVGYDTITAVARVLTDI